MSNQKSELKSLDDHHVIDKLKLLKHINENIDTDISSSVEEYVKINMLKVWNKLADKASDKSIDTLIDILWHDMCKNGGFEYTVQKANDGVQIKCTYCPFVDLAKQANAPDMAFQMFCASDPYIVEGFNNKIGFKRTKTLMQGDDCCDHFYYMK